MTVNIITLCSGYDSQCLALNRLKENYPEFDYKLLAWAEIDKYAIQAHNALFPHAADKNMGDITTCDWSKITEQVDILTYSTPCQSLSSAGLQHGMKQGSGTRSSIIWDVLKAIDALHPRYLLLENVKALVSKKFIGDFQDWQQQLEIRGYTNYVRVLNAKNYGVPQNRERVFMVSTNTNNAYNFPAPFELKTRLKDVLEDEVDEKYYLKQKSIDAFMEYGNKRLQSVVDKGLVKSDRIQYIDAYNQAVTEDISGTITTRVDVSNLSFIAEPKVIIEGNTHPSGHGMNGNVFSSEGLAPTITTNKGEGVKITEPLNAYDDGTCRTIKSQYYKNSTANLLRTGTYGCTGVIEFTEPNVLTAKRTEFGKAVRKDYENGNLKLSRHKMTELEPRTDGVSNTITSVQKDNLVAEPVKISQVKLNVINNFKKTMDKEPDADGWVIGGTQKHTFTGTTDNYGPCITEACGTGGGQIPMILNKTKNKQAEPTIRIPQATKKGYIEVEPGGVFDGSYPDSKTRRGRVQDGGKVSPTITAQGEPLNVYEGIEQCHYRIRKLTPRECFRLMSVSDTDIDKIQAAGISNTQQYKMAGNSIVVDVLYHIFRKMFLETEFELF